MTAAGRSIPVRRQKMNLIIYLAIIIGLCIFLNSFKKKTTASFKSLAERMNGEFKIIESDNRFERLYSRLAPDALNIKVVFSFSGREFDVTVHDNYTSYKGSPVPSLEIGCFLKKTIGEFSIQNGRVLSSSESSVPLERILKTPEFAVVNSSITEKFRFNNKYQALHGPRGDFIVKGNKLSIYKMITYKEKNTEVLMRIIEEVDRLATLIESY